jgi:hypothetical protein
MLVHKLSIKFVTSDILKRNKFENNGFNICNTNKIKIKSDNTYHE